MSTPPRKKKVLILITKSNFGGAQRYCLDIATALKGRYSISVAFGGSGILGRRLAERGISTIPLPFLERDVDALKDWRAFSRIVGLVRAEKPDVLHLNSSKAGGLGALAGRLAGVPRIVFTSHGLAYDEDRSAFARFFIFLATWLTFLLAHAVICISEDTYERVRRLPFAGKRVRLIHNGIDAFPLIPRDEARVRILKDCTESGDDTVWAGTIAEFVRNKGIFYALDACARLESKNVQLFFIGDGDERNEARTRVQTERLSERVCMPGYIPEARELLSAFDMFLLPSIKEGLPYVLLEAGLARLPVIASDIPGARDIIENGANGILVPPKDPEALARAIDDLAKKPETRARLGEALYQTVTHSFTASAMAEKTAALYD